MQSERCKELVIGLFFLIFTVIYASQIPAIRITGMSTFNSEAYPATIAVLMLGLSLWQTYVGIRKFRTTATDAAPQAEGREYATVLKTLFLAIGYVAILEPVGFLISSIAYAFLQIMVMCPPDKKNPLKFFAISVISTIIIYIVFRYGLDLMLPEGILYDLF